MITVVHKSGKNHGMDISTNIKSNIQIIAMLTIILKSPKVIILNGKVMAFNMGFTKKFKSPKIMPNIKKTCHCSVRLKPKKAESENVFITTPETIKLASHKPAIAAII